MGELLLAAGGHGPGRHGTVVNVILLVVLAIAVAAGVIGVVRSRRRGPRA